MAKRLIIAEKPSVAADIARALGGFSRKGDYFENNQFVLSSAVGHLLELVAPEEYDVKKGKWSFKHLPVIPPHFALSPIERSESRLNLLLRLMKRKDVTGLVNACDAGREGELIFRYIMQHARNRKPIERLWLQSMTPQSIREGFASLRPDRQLLPLADAAKSRSEADWLVGINGTRAMTAFNSKEGGFYLTTVGRVQTPRPRRSPSWSSAKSASASSRRAPTGKCRRASVPRRASIPDAGSIRSSRRTTTASASPSGCGARQRPKRSSRPAAARAASPPRKPDRRPSSHRCSTTSPACSAKRTRASGFRPA
jgi:hypothetical protein